jgi:hypothetical protein
MKKYGSMDKAHFIKEMMKKYPSKYKA